jgi:hypothetical protein
MGVGVKTHGDQLAQSLTLLAKKRAADRRQPSADDRYSLA